MLRSYRLSSFQLLYSTIWWYLLLCLYGSHNETAREVDARVRYSLPSKGRPNIAGPKIMGNMVVVWQVWQKLAHRQTKQKSTDDLLQQ
jgi:hypothetical protein